MIPAEITLSAAALTRWQTCRRRFLLELSWEVRKIRPRNLFVKCFRQAVFQLSRGCDLATVQATARTQFLDYAAVPGMEVPEGINSYQIAMDLCATLDTTLVAVSRQVPQNLNQIELVELSPQVQWQSLCLRDAVTGDLHRWTIVEHATQEELAREAHSWYVIGDLAAADEGTNMWVHMVDIGRRRGARQVSPWCKIWQHPSIPSIKRFQRADGKGGWRKLTGDWVPVWLADIPRGEFSASQWVAQMDEDGVTPSLIMDYRINPISASAREATREQIVSEALDVLRTLEEDPAEGNTPRAAMSRPACDGRLPCPWQAVCYSHPRLEASEIEGLKLYQRLLG